MWMGQTVLLPRNRGGMTRINRFGFLPQPLREEHFGFGLAGVVPFGVLIAQVCSSSRAELVRDGPVEVFGGDGFTHADTVASPDTPSAFAGSLPSSTQTHELQPMGVRAF